MQMENTQIFDLLAGLFFAIFGASFIIQNKKIAKQSIKWNSKLWGFSGKEKHLRIAFVIVGFLFALLGILQVFGFLPFKNAQ